MNILDALENYKISILRNSDVFDILSLISLKGSINDDDLIKMIDSQNSNYNLIVLDLFRSNLIKKNKQNDWFVSNIGNLALCKFGISQISSSYTLQRNQIEDDYSHWLSSAVKEEKNIISASQIYTKFNVGEYVINHLPTEIDENEKKKVFYFLYFSSKEDFYTLDKNTFYNLNSKSTSDESLHYVMELYDTCHTGLNTLNMNIINKERMFYYKDFLSIEETKYDKAALLTNFIRLISSIISNKFDFGLSSINLLLSNKIIDMWEAMNIEEEELKSTYTSCIQKYSDKKIIGDLSSMLKKISKQETIEKSSMYIVSREVKESLNDNNT